MTGSCSRGAMGACGRRWRRTGTPRTHSARVVGFTGERWQRPVRTPVGREALYTPHGDGDSLGDLRWRGFHAADGDVAAPQANNLYRRTSDDVFRLYNGGGLGHCRGR